jgi:20S proteasome alpha/beta subunit
LTVVLALRCQDGAVLASDSQGTEADDTKSAVQKVFQLSDSAVWAGSGSGAVLSAIQSTFEGARAALDKSPNVPNSMRSLVIPVLKAEYEKFVAPPDMFKGMVGGGPLVDVVACGLQAGVPWIVEVDRHGTLTDYTDKGRHAVGSGAGFAQMASALLSHYDLGARPIAWGKAAAFRAINAVIQTSASGVGPPIQMWTVTADEGVRRLEDDELTELNNFVGGWQEQERDALAKMFGEPEPEPTPLPPAITEG